jgi:hypothetical protein
VTGRWWQRWGPRAAWGGVATGVVVWGLAVVLGLRRPAAGEQLILSDVVWAVSFGGFLVVGGLLAAKHPRNPVGWCFVTGVIALGTGVAASEYVAEPTRAGAGWVAAFGQLCFALGLPLLTGVWLALFPDGRPVGRRWRWLVPGMLVVGVVFAVTQALVPALGNSGLPVAQPTVLAGAAELGSRVAAVVAPTLLALVLVSVVSVVVRYRRGSATERAQLRWPLWVVGLVALLVLGAVVADRVLGTGSGVAQLLGYLAFVSGTVGLSAAVAISIARYRLYDIDRLVSRTVSYAALTVLLLALYTTGVLAFELLLQPRLGSTHDLVVAVSTLLVAAAFQPLRRRLQQAVDRRFDRRRIDLTDAVEAYNRRLRDELDLQVATEDLRRYVLALLAPSSAGVLLLDGPGRRAVEAADAVASGRRWPSTASVTVSERRVD